MDTNLPTNQTIQEGDTGNAVIILQSKLKDLGYFSANITGSFDTYTKEQVMGFQEEYGLTPTGVVDTETWNLLYSLTDIALPLEIDTKPVLRIGSTGESVKELQTILTSLLYYTGNIDGNFGATTENAVKRFQTNNRLTPDGIVGRDTWSALDTLYSPLAICDEEQPGGDYKIYTVVAGDTLWALARRFGTTVDELKRINNLTSDQLSIGQQLRIPMSEPSYITYTVVAGDSLWAIARRFGTTIDEIKRLNNLTNDLLNIGQQLRIPSTSSDYTIYTVVAGDSLWTIARKFGTTVDEIKRINNLTNNLLNIGQQLRIPTQ